MTFGPTFWVSPKPATQPALIWFRAIWRPDSDNYGRPNGFIIESEAEGALLRSSELVFKHICKFVDCQCVIVQSLFERVCLQKLGAKKFSLFMICDFINLVCGRNGCLNTFCSALWFEFGVFQDNWLLARREASYQVCKTILINV